VAWNQRRWAPAAVIARRQEGQGWNVALDPGDRGRLRRIETELADADPALVERFRRWKGQTGPAAVWPGWSVAPPWMLMVFLVGCTALVAPALGGAVAFVAGCWVVLDTMRRRRGRRGAEGAGGGNLDDGQRHRRSDRG
jgi:hypothetical protein